MLNFSRAIAVIAALILSFLVFDFVVTERVLDFFSLVDYFFAFG